MAEVSESPRAEPPGFVEQKKPTLRSRIAGKLQRVFQYVKRPDWNYKLPEQAFSPAAAAESDKKINPERAEHISLRGCGVRAIMSAAAFASRESNITATTSDTAPKGEEGEWDMRIKQIKEGGKPVKQLSKDLVDLYAKYADHDTPLGNALKKVTVTHHPIEETEDTIKNRIRAGEQVMVFTPNSDPEKSHIFHAGLDKRGHLISFSDEK